MDRKYVIQQLKEYLFDTYSRPQNYIFVRREWFYEMSYSYWAALELLDYVKFSKDDPYISVRRFEFEMNDLTARTNSNVKPFEIARNVALNAIDFLNAMRLWTAYF